MHSTYYGVDIWHADRNSSGIRYYARTPRGVVRADTLGGIRAAIREVAVR